MCACIKIMSADNPASFTAAPLYVHLRAALCQSGPVVAVRLVFAREEDRPAGVTPALASCVCERDYYILFVVVVVVASMFCATVKAFWILSLTSWRSLWTRCDGFHFVVGFVGLRRQAGGGGGGCSVTRTGHWVKMGCFLPGPLKSSRSWESVWGCLDAPAREVRRLCWLVAIPMGQMVATRPY